MTAIVEMDVFEDREHPQVKTRFIVSNSFKSATEHEVQEAVKKRIVDMIVKECQRGGGVSC